MMMPLKGSCVIAAGVARAVAAPWRVRRLRAEVAAPAAARMRGRSMQDVHCGHPSSGGSARVRTLRAVAPATRRRGGWVGLSLAGRAAELCRDDAPSGDLGGLPPPYIPPQFFFEGFCEKVI